MLKAGGLKNYSELAKTVGLSPQAISNYRKKDEVPPRLIFKFAETYNISLDWLLTGTGDMYGASSAASRVCSIALVENANNKAESGSAASPAVLSSDEIVYVGKILTILRCTESVAVPAIKTNIDAFYDTVTS